ncbi:hypothetical protein D9M72_444850 [compost metagenome]
MAGVKQRRRLNVAECQRSVHCARERQAERIDHCYLRVDILSEFRNDALWAWLHLVDGVREGRHTNGPCPEIRSHEPAEGCGHGHSRLGLMECNHVHSQFSRKFQGRKAELREWLEAPMRGRYQDHYAHALSLQLWKQNFQGIGGNPRGYPDAFEIADLHFVWWVKIGSGGGPAGADLVSADERKARNGVFQDHGAVQQHRTAQQFPKGQPGCHSESPSEGIVYP